MTLTLSLPTSIPSFFPPFRHKTHLFKFNPRAVQLSIDSPPTQPQQDWKTGAIVIGAGLAGLAAATHLRSKNIPFIVLEASEAVGGRVRTDIVDGFILDRGFQIFITAYPEAQKLLNYQALDLQKFYSGARVYYDGQIYTVADPLRHFLDSLQSLTNPIGSVLDKFLIGLTRLRVLTKSDEEILTSDEVPTIQLLRSIGFSESIIGSFFRPFFGGIFFDRELGTTSRLFDFIFRCLALGDNTLPAQGISAIPEQLAAKLPQSSILLNSKVESIEFKKPNLPEVKLQNGDIWTSELGVIVAVEEPEAEKLLPGQTQLSRQKPVRSTVCLYFSANEGDIPVQDPVLFLNGSGEGIINNMFFPTNVAPSYAPAGKALVSVSLIGSFEDVSDDDLMDEVVRELSGWFGESIVRKWSHLKTYRVLYAQPNQCPPSELGKDPKVGLGLYLCGDYMTSATFDGALVSGRKAVEALLGDKALSARS